MPTKLKRPIPLLVSGLVVLLIAIVVISMIQIKDTRVVRIKDATINAEVADEEHERALGLGDYDQLKSGQGMLFIFDKADTHAIWMKDVEFSIDVLWLDADKTVVYIEEDMKPNSYPSKFRPPEPAFYVLEVPAGFANKYNISNGDKAEW